MKQKLPLQLRKEERRKGRLLLSILKLREEQLRVLLILLLISLPVLSRSASDSTATSLLYEAEQLLHSGDLVKSFDMFQELKENFIEEENYSALVEVFLRQGEIKDKLNQPIVARSLIDSAVYWSQEIQNSELLAESYNNLGCWFYYQETFDSASFYFEKAKLKFLEEENYESLALAELNLGTMMIEEGDLEGAKLHFQNSLSSNASSDVIAVVARINLGVIFLNLDDYETALFYLKSSDSLAIEAGLTEYRPSILQNLGHVSYNHDKFEEACDYYEEYHLLKDSLYSSKTALAIASLERDYALAKDKLALKESELQTITWQRWAIAIASLFVLGIVVGISSYRRRLAVQHARTQAVLETREDENKRITDLLWSEIGASTKDGKLSLPGQELPEHTIPGAIAAARFLSSQQYNPYLQLGLTRAVENLMSTLNKGKEATITQELEEIEIDKADRLAYYRLLENILVQVYSRANTTAISVKLAKLKSNLVFEITANENLDQQNKRFQSAEARAQQLRGKMKFEEGESSTTIKVDVPI